MYLQILQKPRASFIKMESWSGEGGASSVIRLRVS